MILSDVAAGQPSCPASGPAPAGGCSRAAYRNNNADPTNSAAKNPFRIKVPKTPGAETGSLLVMATPRYVATGAQGSFYFNKVPNNCKRAGR